MNSSTPQNSQTPVTFERRVEGTPEELWQLWTTKEGFEAWWGPVGFRVEVKAIEPEVGGSLSYTMIASDPEQIAAMKAMGQPIAHGTVGKFTVVEPHSQLTIQHMIDFLPGVEPYSNDMTVLFQAEGSHTRMTITIEAHRMPDFTKMATEGMESQLTKLPGALQARRAH
jgi:uncharacterized protein YndB with AHSA1/START domain